MSEQEHVAIESLSVESTGPTKGGAGLENGLASAHTIDHGQVHLATVLFGSCSFHDCFISFHNRHFYVFCRLMGTAWFAASNKF